MPVEIPFNRRYDSEYARIQTLTPLIRRIVARNPSSFTFHGTGTYVVGRDRVAVIDPGPLLDEHLEAILASLGAEEITHLVVTHTHLDHSPAAAPLQRACGAPTYGYGPHGSGRLGGEIVEVEEGADRAFAPDLIVRHGDIIEGDGWRLECVHTPGHTSNHLCYQLVEEKALFSGDHVMGWSTTIVSPPDGDMRRYLGSLRLLLDRDDLVYWPTHGPPIADPGPYVRALIEHRREREEQILACVADGATRIEPMVPVIYSALPAEMHPAAARQILAAVLYLVDEGRLKCRGDPASGEDYALHGAVQK